MNRISHAYQSGSHAGPKEVLRQTGVSALPIGSLVVPFWGLPYRILNVNHKKELLRGLWVLATSEGRNNSGPCFPMRLQCDAKSGSNYSAVSL